MGKDILFDDHRFRSSPFGPPPVCGVYVVCVATKDFEQRYAVYIGSSKNIQRRVLNTRHIYRRLYNLLKNSWVYTMSYPCDDFINVESELIKKYKPRFNKYGK